MLRRTPTPWGMVLDTKERRVHDGDLNKVLSSSTSVDWSSRKRTLISTLHYICLFHTSL